MPPCRPPTGSKFRNVQVLLTFLMCVNLQHFVTERVKPTEVYVPGKLGRGSNLQHKTMPNPLFVWVVLVLFKNCLAGW